MSTFDVRTARGLTIRAEADDEFAAFEQAADYLDEGDEGIVESADNVPVGLDGDDPEA